MRAFLALMCHPSLTLLPLCAALSACPRLRPEAIPYGFRQPIPQRSSASTKAQVTRQSRRQAPKIGGRSWPARARRRCRALIDREFASVSALLHACFASGKAPSAPNGRSAKRPGPSVRPGQLLLFAASFGELSRNGPLTVGVVIRGGRSRILFVYLFDGRARLGRLDLEQPHRRRLPGSRRIANTFVRRKKRGDPDDQRYLAGQLLAGVTDIPSGT